MGAAMSFAAEGWAWAQPCPSSPAKFVLICLAWYANKEGERAFPSIATICRQTHLNERTVRKALSSLVLAGLIDQHIRPGDDPDHRHKSTEYRLKIQEQPPANMQDPPTVNMQDPSPYTFASPPPADMQEGGSTFASPPPANVQDELSNELSTEREEDSLSVSHKPNRRTKAKPSAEPHPRFTEFYDPYPRKETGPKPVIEAFNKAIASGADPDEIIAGLRRYPFKSEREFQPLATTWLNQERWKAVAAPPPQRSAVNPAGLNTWL